MGDLVAAGARSRSRRAWAWWRGLAASDRRAVAAALLVFVAAPFARPVWTILGPETAAAVAFKQAMGFERWYWLANERGAAALDPWGNPLVEVRDPNAWRTYSKGPNGRDEAGAGDDIELDQEAFRTVSTFAFTWSRELLVALGLALLGWRFGVALLAAPRSGRLGKELARALALALPAVALVMATLVFAVNFQWPGDVVVFVASLMWRVAPFDVPPLASIGGSLFFVAYLVALSLRLSRPLEGSEQDAPPDDPARVGFGKLDAAVLGIVLLALTQAPFVKQAWRAVSPKMQAVQAFSDRRSEAHAPRRDPWGSEWCWDGMMDGSIWSAGPNRADENGWGDDIVVSFGLARPPADHLVYLHAPTLLVVGAALLLALWGFARRVIAPRVLRAQRAATSSAST